MRQRREEVEKAWAGAGKKAEEGLKAEAEKEQAEAKKRNEEDAKVREEAGSDKGKAGLKNHKCPFG